MRIHLFGINYLHPLAGQPDIENLIQRGCSLSHNACGSLHTQKLTTITTTKPCDDDCLQLNICSLNHRLHSSNPMWIWSVVLYVRWNGHQCHESSILMILSTKQGYTQLNIDNSDGRVWISSVLLKK